MAQSKPAPKATTRALAKVRQPVVPTKQGADNLDQADFPEIAVLERNFALLEYAFSKMEPGVDYGTVPGITKPFLKIPGTERLQQMFSLRLKVEDVDTSDPSIDFYRHKMFVRAYRLHPETGEEIYLGMGVGICSSRESKYRSRWMKSEELPSQMKAGMMSIYTFKDGGTKEIVDLQKWIDTYGVGSAKMTKFGPRYRVDNPDLADLDNTVAKQAEKRGRADVVQNVTGAHRMFARAEDVEQVGGDATIASKYEEQASEAEPPVEDLEDYYSEIKVVSTPTTAPAVKTAAPAPSRKDTGGEPAPAPTPLSAPTMQKSQQHLCPKHPGQEFKQYPTRAGGTVMAHKIGVGADGKPIWCFEDEVLKEQKASPQAIAPGTPNDLDLVDVKNNDEFLAVLKDIEEKLGWSGEQLKHFLETNYPTSGTDVRDLPVAIRKPLLQDLYALWKSGLATK
jgi:hypothetical protein